MSDELLPGGAAGLLAAGSVPISQRCTLNTRLQQKRTQQGSALTGGGACSDTGPGRRSRQRSVLSDSEGRPRPWAVRTGRCPSAARLSSWCPRPAPPSSVLACPPGAESRDAPGGAEGSRAGGTGLSPRLPGGMNVAPEMATPGAGGRGHEGTRVAASHESSPLGCRWLLPALRSQVGTESPPGALLRCCPTAQDLIEPCLTSVTSLSPTSSHSHTGTLGVTSPMCEWGRPRYSVHSTHRG